MQDQLQKAINLVKKTGDKLIIFDSSKSDSGYVILSLKDYEALILNRSEVHGLTEDELLDKINRDIAIWKSEQSETKDIQSNLDYFSAAPDKNDSGTMDDKKIRKFGKSWSIPPTRKMNAEEIIDEDRQ